MAECWRGEDQHDKLFQQVRPQCVAEHPSRLSSGGQVGQNSSSEVRHLHLWALQQRADVIQEALNHQLHVQLPHLRYVVLKRRAKQTTTAN
ncbi:hypothetical protein DPEC_G00341450, partial [Dallia pectoralis]